MRTTLKHTLAAMAALSALMLSGTACTQDDDLQQPAGTHLLALGEVTIAGAQTATATRADITQDDKTGYTGIRKTKFITGDALALTLKDGSGATIGTPITAKLSTDGTTWTLDTKTYFTAGTTVDAAYIATPAAGMAYGDNLAATNQELKADGTKLSLTLTHANAQVEITPPAGLTPAGGTGTPYSDLTVNITPTPAAGGATPTPETLKTATEGTDTHLRHRTIAPANATLNSVSLMVNGITYTAPIAGTPTLEANKRYPITLTITGDVLKATVGTALNWGAGTDFEGIPTGYDHYIRTVADLVAFRDAVNGGASTVKALQMADIDLSGADWVPIGGEGKPFKGSYNGNGHTISNLTITQSSGTNNRLGLFGEVTDAKIMGVHLRNCKITSTVVGAVCAGALVGHCRASIITLCSATGSVDINGSTAVVGGMIGAANPGASTNAPNYITRCSADVAVTHTSSSQYVGGFAAYSNTTYYAGCISSGTVNKAGTGGSSSGFSTAESTSNSYHAFGCITSSTVTDTYKYDFRNITTVNACLSTQASASFYSNIDAAASSKDNACVSTFTRMEVTGNITPDKAYAALTKNNAPSNGKMKTLHYSKEDGYTLDVVERTWHAAYMWQDNGTTVYPSINMGYEGTPEPIVSGKTVYKVNGYYVTEAETAVTAYTWQEAQTPCATTDAIKKGWYLPSMKDFEVMGGLLSFTGNNGNTSMTIANKTTFLLAFPMSTYWSSDVKSENNAWALYNNGDAAYLDVAKTAKSLVRCVQKIAP